MSLDLFKLLKQSLARASYSIEKYLLQAEVDFCAQEKHITGHLHYVPFDENTGKPDLAGFSEYIMKKLVAFCVPPKQQQAIREGQESDSDTAMELVKAASETLKAITERKDKKASSSGEIGELILFILLEGIIGAPAVASKPYLKMNAQDQVKGCDGVHILHDGNELIIYYGESKLSPNIDYCINDSAKSIKDYHSNGGKRKNRDLTVIAQNIDLNLNSEKKERLESELQYYLNPIKRRRRERTYKEVNACFLGFDHELYTSIGNKPKNERNSSLKHEIEAVFPKILEKIVAKNDGDISDYNIHYFVIPFSSVEEMQKHCEEYVKPFSFHKKGAKANAG